MKTKPPKTPSLAEKRAEVNRLIDNCPDKAAILDALIADLTPPPPPTPEREAFGMLWDLLTPSRKKLIRRVCIRAMFRNPDRFFPLGVDLPHVEGIDKRDDEGPELRLVGGVE